MTFLLLPLRRRRHLLFHLCQLKNCEKLFRKKCSRFSLVRAFAWISFLSRKELHDRSNERKDLEANKTFSSSFWPHLRPGMRGMVKNWKDSCGMKRLNHRVELTPETNSKLNSDLLQLTPNSDLKWKLEIKVRQSRLTLNFINFYFPK